MSTRDLNQVMYRVENVYRLLPPDFFKGNYETYVVNTKDGHLLEQRNKLVEQLYGSIPLPHSKVTQEDYSVGNIVIVKIYSGVFIGEVTEMDNEYVTLSSCMKIMSCNMGVAITELDNPEKFPINSVIKVF